MSSGPSAFAQAPAHPSASDADRVSAVQAHDRFGRPTRVKAATGQTIDIFYGSNLVGYRKDSVSTTLDGRVLGLSYRYNAQGRLLEANDVSGSSQYYRYDGLGRLDTTLNNAGEPVAAYDYTYTSGDLAADPNRVTTTRIRGSGPDQVQRTILDGLGRPVQKVTETGNDLIVRATAYDETGRKKRTYRPVTDTDDTLYDSDDDYTSAPYTETTYEANTLGRAAEVDPPGNGSVQKSYGVTTISSPSRFHGLEGTFRTVRTTDESGDVQVTYQNSLGRKVAVVSDPGGIDAVTRFQYDAAGRLTQVTRPEGEVVSYWYDARGQVVARSSPSAGTKTHLRDAAGTARFTQGPVQESEGEVAYTCTDGLGRPVETGVAELSAFGAGSFADLAPSQSCEADSTSRRTVRAYDAAPDLSSGPWKQWSLPQDLPFQNVRGELAARAHRVNEDDSVRVLSGRTITDTQSYTAPQGLETDSVTIASTADVTLTGGESVRLGPGTTVEAGGQLQAGVDSSLDDVVEPVWRLSFYSYDGEGRLAQKDVFQRGVGRITYTYTYDRQGRLTATTTDLQDLGRTFHQWYDYDDRGQLAAVYASPSPTKPSVPVASYTYTADGQIEATDWAEAGVQVPRRYTERGWLKEIGDVSQASRPFNALYTYHNDGNVERATVRQRSTGHYYRYDHDYDALDRLTAATYSYYDGGWQQTGDQGPYDVRGIDYDRNGNLTSLTRHGRTGSEVDALTYKYENNQISGLIDGAGEMHSWDAGPGPFAYDAAGRMTQAPAPVNLSGAQYNAQGLPTTMRLEGDAQLSYWYSAEGQRTTLKRSGAPATRYVRDGKAMPAVVQGGSLDDWRILRPGGTAIGRVTANGGRRYFVTDHLGSIRAVIGADGNVQEARDYYPYGLPLPGQYARSGTRADYTGHEKDEETGLHYAGARYYSAAFARFGVIDPHADKYPSHSPYHYAANNPLKISDPSGKFWVNEIRTTDDVRAGRIGQTSARVLHEAQAVPGVSRAVFAGMRALWVRGNSDHSALNPSAGEIFEAIVSSVSHLGTRLPPGSPQAKMMDPQKKNPVMEIAAADELAFKALASLHEGFEGPEVSVGEESYDLIDDVGSSKAFSLGLNSELKEAWEDENLNPVNKFAKELGKYQNAAKNIMDEYNRESKQQEMMEKWIRAQEAADDG